MVMQKRLIEKFEDFMKMPKKDSNDKINSNLNKDKPVVKVDTDSIVVDDAVDDEYFDDFFEE